mgnify:FL=1|tara:strand:+ start:7822 stop:8454 length:633 start_codon:yes stop_codon:yes gene_type:complete
MPYTSSNISLKVIWGEDVVILHFPETMKALTRFANSAKSLAREILTKQGKNTTGTLSDSLSYVIEMDEKKEFLTMEFDAPNAPYWKFVNWGVQGFIKGDKNKAPDSPFSFGSGKQQEKGTLRGGINRWVTQKNLEGVRDKKGRFIPRKSMIFLISKSIYNHGIAPSMFYSNAVDRTWRRLERNIQNAILSDYELFLETNMPLELEIKLDL